MLFRIVTIDVLLFRIVTFDADAVPNIDIVAG